MKLYFHNKSGDQLAIDTCNRCYTFDAPRVSREFVISVNKADMLKIQVELLHSNYKYNWYGN